MDERQKAEEKALRALFEHPGWPVLIRNTKAQIDAFRDGFPFNVNTIEQLYYSRGMMAALQSVMTLEQQFAAQDAAASEEESDAYSI